MSLTLAAVVLHFRNLPALKETLRALLSQRGVELEALVVVDSRSDDGSAAQVRGEFPTAEVLELNANRGYAAGMNIGTRRALATNPDAVLLLTHDCRLAAAPMALEALAARLAEDEQVGVVGPLMGLSSRPEVVWSAGGRLDHRTWDLIHHRDPPLMAGWDGREPYQVDWLDGACLLVRSAVLRAAGPLDERYFLYCEEAEYLCRVRRLGWRVECVPDARAWQEPGMARTPRLWTRNRLLFTSSTGPRWRVARELSRATYHIGRRLLRPPLSQAWIEVRPRVLGIGDFLLRRWGQVE